MTMYESDLAPPPYTPPAKSDINHFVNNVQRSLETNNKREREYHDYDNPDRDNKKPRSIHVDYRDARNQYSTTSSATSSSYVMKSHVPCWYKLNGFECAYASNTCYFSHNPDIIKKKRMYMIPELCPDGKSCKTKCKKYHNLNELQEAFRRYKEIVYHQDTKLYENIRSIRIKDDKIYNLENTVSSLQNECDHWRNKYERTLKDLEMSDKRSRAFEKIIVNNY